MAEEESYEALSIEQRLSHKVWKARVSGYTDLVNTFKSTVSEDDPAFAPFLNGSAVADWCRDANAVAQEKGLEAACALIDYAGKRAARTRQDVVPALVEKCLGAARAGTKSKAIELCLLYIEVEDDLGEGVIEDVSQGLGAKQPKVVASCVTVLKEAIRLFGAKTISVKPVLRLIPRIFAHSDKNVRAEGTGLALALHSYLGPALDSHLSELKPVQVKELGDAFAAAGAAGEGFPHARQSRFTRKQQRERDVREAENTLSASQGPAAADDGAANGEDGGAPVDESIDPYELADPVNVLDNVPAEFYTHLTSSKWKDRKELALDPLYTLVNTIRLQEGNYDELTRALAGRVASDANVACVTAAANCIECLAKGLRGAFARYRANVMSPLLERLKEKKPSVVESLANALDAVFKATSIKDILEDVPPFAKHKNPAVKAEALKYLVRCLRETTSAPSPVEAKPTVETLCSALEDGAEPVRVAAADALGTLMKVLGGERALGGALDKLDDLRKAKVQEAFEKAEVKIKSGAKARPPPAAAASAPAPSRAAAADAKPKPRVASTANADKENEPLKSAASQPSSPAPSRAMPAAKAAALSRLANKKPAAAPAAAATAAPVKRVPAAGAAAPKAGGGGAPSEPLKYKYSQEDAEAKAESLLPAEALAGLAESNWKARLAAIENLAKWVSEDGGADQVDAEIIVRSLAKRPGWKESNFQVSTQMYGIFQALADKSPTFSKSSVALTTPPISDKLGDMKLKKPAAETLIKFAEKTSLGFVLSQAYEPMSKQKAPKAQADALVFVEQALRDFGIAGVAVRDLIEFLKNALKSSNAAVRTNATKTLSTLKLYVGNDITVFIQDLNPQLLATIEGEFAKTAGENPPEPTRTSADLAATASDSKAGGAANGDGGGDDAAMDELFPRVDLDKLVPSAVIGSCSDSAWKLRKESLETIQGILEANKRLKPNMSNDLVGALRGRLADSNKICQGLALDCIGRIATGMGKPFDRFAKSLASATAMVLADQKITVRAAGTATLNAMTDACGLDSFVATLDKPLGTANPVLRKDLLAFLESRTQDPSIVAVLDLAPLVAPLTSCLEDRNNDVRKLATALLPAVIQRAGYNAVAAHASKLKPASKSTVMPLIEAARGAASSAEASARPTKDAGTPEPPASPLKKVAPASSSVRPASSASVATSSKPVAAVSRSLRAGAPSTGLPPPRSAVDDGARPSTLARARPAVAGPSKFGAAQPVRTPASATPESSAEHDAPFKSADPQPKRARAAKETGALKWVVDGPPRSDQVEALYQQMLPCVSQSLLDQLFSRDHNSERDFLQALTFLDSCAGDSTFSLAACELPWEDMRARFVANIDLVFKYVTLRIAGSNTTITVKCLDLVDHSIALLAEDDYRLSQYEANGLLISLIAKVGDPKETIRQRIRAVFRSICTIYPLSHVFQAILENGLGSRNARTRAECADELGELIQRQGVTMLPTTRALPALAKLIGDRDAGVRTAALSSIGQVYTLAGADYVYSQIGQVPDKERTMLDERLKRTTTTVAAAAATPLPASPARMPASPAAKSGGMSRLPALRKPGSVASGLGGANGSGSAIPSPRRPQASRIASIPRSSPAMSRHASSGVVSRAGEQEIGVDDMASENGQDSAATIASIVSADTTRSVEALKRIQSDISQQPETLLADADQLIDALTRQIPVAFDHLDADSPQPVLRLCKHLMSTLSLFFDHKTLGQAVSVDTLSPLLAELTSRLLQTADNTTSESIASLSKVLNMVLIRIFHHADQSVCFGALFNVLQQATQDMRELEGLQLDERAKYAELVMKCLWKVSKTVKESLENQQLSASRLLRDINVFLQTIPPAEWRRRLADQIPLADMPLRTVKTILQQVVAVYGEGVFDQLDEIDSAENSFVYQYLYRLVSNASGSGTVEPSLPKRKSAVSMRTTSSQSGAPSEAAAVSSPTLSSATSPRASTDPEIEMNHRLKVIFDKIGDPSESRNGIAELYAFQKAHPEAEARVASWITKTGTYFQTYLKRALDNHAAQDRDRPSREGVLIDTSESPSRPSSSRAAPLTQGGHRASSSQTRDLSELHSMFGFKETAASSEQ